MDRFEESRHGETAQSWQIYIPVWIDLKQSWQRKTAQSWQIYIPVWIDLKKSLFGITEQEIGFTFQYG